MAQGASAAAHGGTAPSWWMRGFALLAVLQPLISLGFAALDLAGIGGGSALGKGDLPWETPEAVARILERKQAYVMSGMWHTAVPVLVALAGVALWAWLRQSRAALPAIWAWVAGRGLDLIQEVVILAQLRVIDATYDTALARPLDKILDWLQFAGDVLTFGIGGGLFCTAMLLTRRLAVWIALLGLVAIAAYVLHSAQIAMEGLGWPDWIGALAWAGVLLVFLWQMAFGWAIMRGRGKK